MRTFQLYIDCPVYRDMLGGGYVDREVGYFPFKARNQATAERRVPRIVRKFNKVFDGDAYKAKAVSLSERIEYVVELKKY